MNPITTYPAASLPPEAELDPATPQVVMEASLASDLSELAKTRLTLLVLLTTLVGYAFASRGPLDWEKLLHTLVGTTLVAVCSSILNQAMERDTDALMHRTERRPLVTRRFPFVGTVLAGLLLGALGLIELSLYVGPSTAFLTALTLVIYVLAYTPLKRLTPLNTLVGTIPGALPPLIGATAAQGHLNVEGWSLFALMALWQLPHFYAIAWLYRDDYRAAGLRMVSVTDDTGRFTARHALVSALLLFPASLLPSWIAGAGVIYEVAAVVLSLVFIGAAVSFVRQPDRLHARRLFLTSIIYLPLVLIALAVDVWVRSHLS